MKFTVLMYVACWGQMVFSQTCDLTIAIPNVKNQQGQIQIGIYSKAETFPHVDEQYKLIFIDANRFSGIDTIKDLPIGAYAIALMHDENSDGICNRNFLGIPKEGYGFSNNIRPVLFIPSFNDCKIDLNRNMSITIKLIY